ncbi:MAG: hypothetical protein KR126chlam2_00947, partial [Chlamydiae bacterium]|nr:hypothetical protein [Chlamydiota bacterium]
MTHAIDLEGGKRYYSQEHRSCWNGRKVEVLLFVGAVASLSLLVVNIIRAKYDKNSDSTTSTALWITMSGCFIVFFLIGGMSIECNRPYVRTGKDANYIKNLG